MTFICQMIVGRPHPLAGQIFRRPTTDNIFSAPKNQIIYLYVHRACLKMYNFQGNTLKSNQLFSLITNFLLLFFLRERPLVSHEGRRPTVTAGLLGLQLASSMKVIPWVVCSLLQIIRESK